MKYSWAVCPHCDMDAFPSVFSAVVNEDGLAFLICARCDYIMSEFPKVTDDNAESTV